MMNQLSTIHQVLVLDNERFKYKWYSWYYYDRDIFYVMKFIKIKKLNQQLFCQSLMFCGINYVRQKKKLINSQSNCYHYYYFFSVFKDNSVTCYFVNETSHYNYGFLPVFWRQKIIPQYIKFDEYRASGVIALWRGIYRCVTKFIISINNW